MAEPAVDGSVRAVADRIAARRLAGEAPKPEGPAPEGTIEDDATVQESYEPEQNLHVDEPDEQPEAELAPEPEDFESDGETAVETAEDEPDAESVELAFESVDELAELVGLDVSDLMSQVKVNTVIDGEPGEITLADLRKGHQLESSFTRKNQAFIEAKQAFEKESEERRARMTDQFTQAGTLLEQAQKELYTEFNSVDWNSLQVSNPAEWNMKRQQFGERQARLNQLMQETTDQVKKAQEEQQKADDEARERHLVEQHNLLMAAIPSWKKDENKRAQEGKQVAEYLNKMGYTPEELDTLSDHRLVLLARSALGLSGPSKQKLSLAQKKVEKVKNLVKPGNQAKRRQQGNAALSKDAKQAKSALKKSGSTKDAAKAILARRLALKAQQKPARRARP